MAEILADRYELRARVRRAPNDRTVARFVREAQTAIAPVMNLQAWQLRQLVPHVAA